METNSDRDRILRFELFARPTGTLKEVDTRKNLPDTGKWGKKRSQRLWNRPDIGQFRPTCTGVPTDEAKVRLPRGTSVGALVGRSSVSVVDAPHRLVRRRKKSETKSRKNPEHEASKKSQSDARTAQVTEIYSRTRLSHFESERTRRVDQILHFSLSSGE